jgi:hypothetical protein
MSAGIRAPPVIQRERKQMIKIKIHIETKEGP